MKKTLTIALLLLIMKAANAQSVGINNTATPPDPSAMLDISSNSKGILIPRLRTSERLSIINPALGLMVFDVDTWSFWYFAIGSVWKEITNNTDGPKGNAGGDLGGTYPNPHVKGLAFKPFANLNPGHLQIIKWENDADEWQFRNDSLMLPYNVTDTSAGSLFSITNSSLNNIGNVIIGRQRTGSGFTIQNAGIWGDNNSGYGVVGTSSNYHGVYGQAQIPNVAGVIGSNNGGGYGVWGDVNQGGYSIYGTNSSASSLSRAGLFKNTNASGTGTVLEASTTGLGRVAEFASFNSSNTQSAIYIQQNGTGSSLSANTVGTGTTSATIDASNNGTGAGVRGHSFNGKGFHGSSINSNAGYFETNATANTSATVAVNTNSAGPGLTIDGNSGSSTADITRISNQGMGRALYAYNGNLSAASSTAFFSNIGLGSCLYLEKNNSSSSLSPAALIYNNANGAGLDVQNLKQGTALKAINEDASNTVPVIFAEHKGSGRGLDLRMTKTTNNSYGAYIQHDGIGTGIFVMKSGTGRGAEINIGNAANTQPGLLINSAAALGAEILVTGITNPVGLKAAINSGSGVNNGVAILGIASANDYNGIGVKGVGDGGINASNSIGVLGEGKPGTNAIGVKGTSYRDDTESGAVTGVNLAASGGTGVYAEASGGEGFGVMGVVGNTGNHSVAARFKNNYNNNLRAVVEIFSNGKGSAIYCNNTNPAGNDVQIRVGNAGTGDFLRFTDGLGFFVTTIAKNGNIKTDGTVTVKDDKGIVRSSTSTQLRTEIVLAVLVLPTSLTIPEGGFHDFNVTYSQSFSQPPAISFGNLFDLAANPQAAYLTGTIFSAGTSGCVVRVFNSISGPVTLNAGTATWKLIAIGAD